VTSLPNFVLRAPWIFYAAATALFVYSFALGHYELWVQYRFAGMEEAPLRVARFRIFQTALTEFIYAASNGVLAHILLAIWYKLPAAKGSAENVGPSE
jgi:hypothetical protein